MKRSPLRWPIMISLATSASSTNRFFHALAFQQTASRSFSRSPSYLSMINEESSSSASQAEASPAVVPPPLYLEEGLFAVDKPLGWTSQQVVGRIRTILEKDARERGAPDNRKKRRKPWMKVGHGGTLDPLASGVLVVGVGKGTKELQKYLVGYKGYRAGAKLGFQTTTLDLDTNGEVIAQEDFSHVSVEMIEDSLAAFRGDIQQVPPIFSALKKDGKKLYELGRKGLSEDDIEIEPRNVTISRLEFLADSSEAEEFSPPETFGLDVQCSGGTYIRCLIRDIGIALGTRATMTSLARTKQGSFLPEHTLSEDEWNATNIYNQIRSSRHLLVSEDAEGESS